MPVPLPIPWPMRVGILARHPEMMASDALHYVGAHSSPAAHISLRAIDPERFVIINEAAGGEVRRLSAAVQPAQEALQHPPALP